MTSSTRNSPVRLEDFTNPKRSLGQAVADHMHQLPDGANVCVMALGGGHDVIGANGVCMALKHIRSDMNVTMVAISSHARLADGSSDFVPIYGADGGIVAYRYRGPATEYPPNGGRRSLGLETMFKDIVILPSGWQGDKGPRGEALYNTLESNLKGLVGHLGANFIVGIDTGGDSLWGGNDGVEGQDFMAYKILSAMPGTTYVHSVVSPCGDAETEQDVMLNILSEHKSCEVVHPDKIMMDAIADNMDIDISKLSEVDRAGYESRTTAGLLCAAGYESFRDCRKRVQDQLVVDRYGNKILVSREMLAGAVVFGPPHTK